MVTPISYVVPTHNEEATLPGIIATISERLSRDFPGSEIIVVENGSTDGSARVAEALAKATVGSDTASVRHLTSQRGLGHAMRTGVQASVGDIVAMTGGLAFGFSDLDGALRMEHRPPFVIGSKAHPDSQLHRSRVRRAATAGFKVLRRMLMHTTVGDSQGSFILDGATARSLFPLTVEAGYIAQAEFVALGELAGLEIVEIPVVLRTGQGRSSVKPFKTSVEMLLGLIRIRARIPEMRSKVAELDLSTSS